MAESEQSTPMNEQTADEEVDNLAFTESEIHLMELGDALVKAMQSTGYPVHGAGSVKEFLEAYLKAGGDPTKLPDGTSLLAAAIKRKNPPKYPETFEKNPASAGLQGAQDVSGNSLENPSIPLLKTSQPEKQSVSIETFQRESAEVVSMLLFNRADPNYLPPNKTDMVSTAIWERNLPALKALLQYPIEAKSFWLSTAMEVVIREANGSGINYLQALLDAGVTPDNAPDADARNPLNVGRAIASFNTASACKLLLDAGANPNSIGPGEEYLAQSATRVLSPDLLRKLAEREANFTIRSEEGNLFHLMAEVRPGGTMIINEQHAKGEKDYNQAAPEVFDIVAGRIIEQEETAARARGKLGAQQSFSDKQKKHVIAKYLNEPNAEGELPIHLLVRRGRPALLEKFLEYAPETLETYNIYGQTPLHAGLLTEYNNSFGRPEMVQALLEHNASLDARTQPPSAPNKIEGLPWNLQRSIEQRLKQAKLYYHDPGQTAQELASAHYNASVIYTRADFDKMTDAARKTSDQEYCIRQVGAANCGPDTVYKVGPKEDNPAVYALAEIRGLLDKEAHQREQDRKLEEAERLREQLGAQEPPDVASPPLSSGNGGGPSRRPVPSPGS